MAAFWLTIPIVLYFSGKNLNKDMKKNIAYLLLLIFFSCNNISNPFSDKTPPKVLEEEIEEEIIDVTNESPYLIATLDKLTIRVDSSKNADFLTKVNSGDTLVYLGEHSIGRLNLFIRKKYYHEPWLKIQIKKNEKIGWVYAGGIRFVSQPLKKFIRRTGKYSKQIDAPDVKWEGDQPAPWTSAGIQNPKDFKTFLAHFKEWVATDNVEELSKIIDYPADPVWNKAYFKEYYSEIFDSKLKAVVANQRLDKLFRRDKGVVFGKGEIIFANRDKGYKLIAFNSYAQKVKDKLEIENYQEEFSILANTYTRPTKEANPPSIRVELEEQALVIYKIAYLGNQKTTTNLGGFKYRITENEDLLFEQKIGRDIQRKITFKMNRDSSYRVTLDDIKDYSMGQKFILH